VLLVDGEGRVLLQQRDDAVPPAGVGRWAIPGGGREGGEDPLATARREFVEETGVRLSRIRQFGSFAAPHDPWMRDFRVHLFVAEDDVPRSAISVNEGMDFQYWAPDEAMALPMNPTTRRYLDEVLTSRLYLAAKARRSTGARWSSVIALDRWGRALLIAPGDSGRRGAWSLPGAPDLGAESPDATGFRGFMEETGHALDALRFFAILRQAGELSAGPAPATHVYYDDPDLALTNLDLPPGREATYAGPEDIGSLLLSDYAAAVLERFFASPAYRAMFH